MRYFLFILANALLFIRPSELIAELYAVEIYRYVILACLVVSLPIVLRQITLRFAGVPPILTCVVLLLPAVFLSGLSHGNFDLIQDTVIEYGKILVYFFLLISLVDDTTKLRQFLGWIGVFCAAVTLIAVLRYHTDLNIGAAPTKTLGADGKGIMHGTYVVDQIRDLNTGELVSVNRMCGTGIFNDPNDFALVLVTAIPLCIFFLTDPARKSLRPFWFVLLLLFAYALFLTSSRGGFLAMLAGLATLFHLRYGAMKSLLLGAVVLPVLLVVFAGRMTTFSPEEGTGMARIQLWNDGLFIFQQSPIIGVGVENFRQFSRHVAHNSFIHGYAEMGLLGGTLFVGAFYFALKGLYDLRQHQTPESENAPSIDPELHRLHPYLIAMLVAYTVGICFLSRNYIVPTYMMLGLALVYMRLRATLAEPAAAPAWSRFVWPQLAGVSGGVLIASFAFVRLFAK